MEEWLDLFINGKKQLNNKRYEESLEYFTRSFALCPAESVNDCCCILFFIGVLLYKMGLRKEALACWGARFRLKEDKGYYTPGSGKKYCSYKKTADQVAFYEEQLRRYFLKKTNMRFESEQEKQQLALTIEGLWQEILESGLLDGLSSKEKKALFREIPLPWDLSSLLAESRDDVVAVNFVSKKRLSAKDSCYCKSGRSYSQCCGSTNFDQDDRECQIDSK